MAMEANIVIKSIYMVQNALQNALFKSMLIKYPSVEVFVLDAGLYAKSAYREDSGGILALAETPVISLNSLKIKEAPLILVISGVEKPGNIGAMLRTVDACKADLVICCDMPGDLYNPNTIRASLGTVFTVPVVCESSHKVMNWLRENQIKTYCSNLHEAEDYLKQDYKGDSAIVMVTEAFGVSEEWVKFSDVSVKIQMQGKIDSMNVSVAAAVLLFEAVRQRTN